MILDNNIFGELRGKLSLTPEQARDFFGYKMKPGAIGVYFSIRNGKQIIASLMPSPNPKTPQELMVWNRNSALISFTKSIKPLIHKVWNPIAHHNYSGWHLFYSINAKSIGLPPDWSKLLVTKGPLTKPIIKNPLFAGKSINVYINALRNSKLSIATWEPEIKRFYTLNLDRDTGKFYFHFPHFLTSTLWIYAWSQKNNIFSDSSSMEVKYGKVYR